MTPAQERPARWTLSRAGIINVYQYGDETLDFGGGRLLLRGVNGSGKSTAMNMLLPFLLDARAALAAADSEGAVLPRDPRAPGATPWDPTLREDFAGERRIVHQERLLPGLIE